MKSVQHLLGHCNISTTSIYLHVTNNLISNVTSPLEKIGYESIDPFAPKLNEKKGGSDDEPNK